MQSEPAYGVGAHVSSLRDSKVILLLVRNGWMLHSHSQAIVQLL